MGRDQSGREPDVRPPPRYNRPMAVVHLTVNDFIPTARGMSEDGFCARYDHPFLFGREVLEEEFRFQTVVTEGPGIASGDGRKSTDVFRIRHWVIPIMKPEGAPAQDRIFLGRGETNDVCVPHKTVSKLHAYFVRDPRITTRWFVVDTGSANGTKANGMRIPARARVALLDGDTICFGRCVFQWMGARTLHERLVAMVPQPAPGDAIVADEDEDADPYELPHDRPTGDD